MILFIALGFLIARIGGNRLRVIFREISLIPMLILELVFWVFQICAWSGEYRFVQYASMLQMLYILSLLWPVLKFRLYVHAIAGASLVGIGSLMNRLVMNANGGQMPVYPSLSRLTGYFVGGAMEAAGDVRHVLMTESTHLKVLGDYIDVGFSIMSPGDVLIHGFVTLVVFGVINELNRKGQG